MKKSYSWIAPLAWAMPELLQAMSAYPVASAALMVYAYMMTRKQP